MELLGHSSISLTMNTYGQVLEEMKKETAPHADAIFGPDPDHKFLKPTMPKVV